MYPQVYSGLRRRETPQDWNVNSKAYYNKASPRPDTMPFNRSQNAPNKYAMGKKVLTFCYKVRSVLRNVTFRYK